MSYATALSPGYPLDHTPKNTTVSKRKTQEDQDKEDDKAREDARKGLEKSWLDRLQLISVISTFFASVEAQLLSITVPTNSTPGSKSGVNLAANAGLCGSLIFHMFAAILSFTAAFVLTHYRLKEAKREKNASFSGEEDQEVWSCNPHVAMERTGYKSGMPPMHLLRQFHTICILMAVIGFFLAAVGIMCFVWGRQARSVAIFSSAAFAICLVTGVVVFFMSSPRKEE